MPRATHERWTKENESRAAGQDAQKRKEKEALWKHCPAPYAGTLTLTSRLVVDLASIEQPGVGLGVLVMPTAGIGVQQRLQRLRNRPFLFAPGVRHAASRVCLLPSPVRVDQRRLVKSRSMVWLLGSSALATARSWHPPRDQSERSPDKRLLDRKVMVVGGCLRGPACKSPRGKPRVAHGHFVPYPRLCTPIECFHILGVEPHCRQVQASSP